jgi:hypothetical protein
MTINPSAVTELVSRLNALHGELKSWRKVQKQCFPGVKFGTLQRIAGGGYLPKERSILKELGLLERRKRTKVEKAISKMARETKKAVLVVK